MKSNNQYLESINESVTGQTVDVRRTNNWYLRSIAKNTSSEEIHGHRTDNYYLKRIALNMEDLDIKELLQTITELRGEVEELEELLANDIHLFSCCKDIVQTGESLGLFAYCKADGEVEGNTVYFYAIDNTPIPSTITITSDKTVLSYSDNDKAVLTATVLDGDNNPLSDETVVFKIGSTVLDTVQTDNNGEAEYTYSSQGVGDVTITVECMNLQETFVVEDCWNAHLSEISITGDTVNSIGMDNVHNVQNDNFILEFDHKGNGNICIGATSQYSTPSTANYRLALGTYDSKYYCAVRTSSTDETSGSSEDNSTYYSYKIEKQGTTVKFYVDNVLLATKTVTFFNDYSEYSIYNIKWGGGTDYMKNIRLKALPLDAPLSVSASKDKLSYVDEDSCTLTATLTGDDVANKSVAFKNGNTVLDTVQTDNNGIAEYEYTSQGVGDVTITVECMNLQETFVVEDCYFYTLDGTGLSGTYSISDEYVYDLRSDVTMPIPSSSDFIISMKYAPYGKTPWNNNLWLVGSDSSNGVLIGAEGTDSRLSVYDYTNGSPSSQQIQNNSFNSNGWNDIEIEYNEGVWTSRVGANSVSYSKTFTPSIMRMYDRVQVTMLKEIKVKLL